MLLPAHAGSVPDTFSSLESKTCVHGVRGRCRSSTSVLDGSTSVHFFNKAPTHFFDVIEKWETRCSHGCPCGPDSVRVQFRSSFSGWCQDVVWCIFFAPHAKTSFQFFFTSVRCQRAALYCCVVRDFPICRFNRHFVVFAGRVQGTPTEHLSSMYMCSGRHSRHTPTVEPMTAGTRRCFCHKQV